MKVRRIAGGFTVLELMTAVMIISLLLAVSAVNIIQYNRAMTQMELDGIAHEIFVAAQNHLTMAESQGFLGISNENFGTSDTSGVYYYVVNGNIPDAPPNMLNLMLPYASIDETVRQGGSYVIRYQKQPALVLDVFYATTNGRFAYAFTPAEVGQDGWIAANRGPDNERTRGHYPDGAGDNIIGWYGPSEQDTPTLGKPLQAPVIEVVNAETLRVEVTNPNASDKFKKMGLRLVVKGEQSGQTCSIDLRKSESDADSNPDSSYARVLDDVTSKDNRFYKVCAGLYPGEDITVYAEAYNNQELTNIATSASVTTNSLFASLEPATFPLSYNAFCAKISNFRHLENLDCGTSGIKFDELEGVSINGKTNPFYYILEESKKSIIVGAKQTGNMDWLEFKTAIGNDNASVYYDDTRHSKSGCYWPVTIGDKTVTNGGNVPYDGKGYKISNVSIDVEGDAGLFAAIGNESAISDVSKLELWNFEVTSTKGAAGVLAGVVKGSNVNGVLAAHEADKTSEVNGKTSVGGLVGEIQGSSTVTQSAAAVYVVSDDGDAGGLIGKVDSDGAVTVSDSYAGGHTKDGEYERNDKNNHNVKGGKDAGGLIGSVTHTGAEELTVKNCYATTSVQGANAGGFIGSVTHTGTKEPTIENCYATGYVVGTGSAGAFAGIADTGVNFTNDGYFSLVTGTLAAVGSGADANADISAWDTDFNAYGAKTAKPYDSFLQTYYKGLYSFRTISELNSASASPEWMSVHYGDWPPLDTLVINEPDA